MTQEPVCVGRTSAPFKSRLGAFRLEAFGFQSGAEHVALVVGDVSAGPPPLVRVQSACLTGTALGALLCDCEAQLHQAMQRVASEGTGMVLYLAQEGRGHGLVEKVAQLERISRGENTIEAAEQRGESADVRDYGEAAFILRETVGSRPVRLLTNNPHKVQGLETAGVAVAEEVPIETDPTPHNLEYLRVKKQLLGHRLTKV